MHPKVVRAFSYPASLSHWFLRLTVNFFSFWLYSPPLASSGSELFTCLSLHPLSWWHSYLHLELCRAQGRPKCLLNVQCLSNHQGKKGLLNCLCCHALDTATQFLLFFLSKIMLFFLTIGFKTKISASMVPIWPSDWIFPHWYGWLVWNTIQKGMQWWFLRRVLLTPIWIVLSAHWITEPGY